MFKDCQDSSFTSNVMSGVLRQRAALDVSGCSRMNIAQNSVLDSDGAGILLENVQRSVLTGNIVRDDRDETVKSKEPSLRIIGGNDNTVVGNTIGALPKSPHAAVARLFDASATFDDAGPMADVGAIPEPASWLMLIVGFGLVGSAVRRSRRIAAA